MGNRLICQALAFRCASCCHPRQQLPVAHPCPDAVPHRRRPDQAGWLARPARRPVGELRRDLGAAAQGTASRLTLTVTDPLGDRLHDRREPTVRAAWQLWPARPSLDADARRVLHPVAADLRASRPGRWRPPAPIGSSSSTTADSPRAPMSMRRSRATTRSRAHPQFGRQSFFNDRLYEVYDPYSGRTVQTDNNSLVKRQCTINAIATGKTPIVIGGFLRKEMKAAEYTAAGARKPRPRAALARRHGAVRRHLRAGRPAGGEAPYGGSRVAVAGTSVAATDPRQGWLDDLMPAARATARQCGTRPISTRPIRQPTRRRRPGRPSRPRNAAATAASGASAAEGEALRVVRVWGRASARSK